MKAFDIYYSENIVDVNSEYFIKYKNLINENENTKPQKYKTSEHHIVPKCYYVSREIDIDNSEYNKVNLLHKYHALAHYYLFMCATDNKFKFQNCTAFQRMFFGGALNPSQTVKDIKFLSEEDILSLLDDYQVKIEEVNKYFTKVGVEGHKAKEVWFTEEHKQNIAEKTKAAMWRPDVRAKTTAAYNSDEWRKKDSEHVKEQWKNTNLRDIISAANGKAVRCIETGKEYLSISRAAQDLNISSSIIGRQLKGNIKDYDVYHFERI